MCIFVTIYINICMNLKKYYNLQQFLFQKSNFLPPKDSIYQFELDSIIS